MLKTKILFLTLILTFVMSAIAVFGVADFAMAESLTGIEYGEQTGLGNENPIVILAKVIRIALGFLGIIAIILIIYAGFLWMTSNGNEEKIEQAKKILKNAVIGLLIIFSAFAIVSFILNKMLGGGPSISSSNPSGGNYGGGIGALGSGILQSVYPEPNQKEVPRNTSIVVTFREVINPQTICQTSGTTCSGELLVGENIRIFQTNQGDACLSGNCNNNVVNVRTYTNDNKTFVFVPNVYLGSPSEYIWHSVFLGTGIKKADGSDAFRPLENGYEWRFEVSNRLDLTPPQVISGGVFPVPDNEQDTLGAVVAAVQATGSIVVNSQPGVYVAASASNPVPQGSSGPANLEGSYNCQSNGPITVSITSTMTVNVSGVAGVVGGDSVDDGRASLGCGLTLVPQGSTSFASGNSWTFSVIAERQADTLIVGRNLYTFVASGAMGNQINLGGNTSATANNIRTVLNTHPDASTSGSGNQAILTARVAGAAGNNIAISTTSGGLNITPMSGGSDRQETSTIRDKRDKPRNSVIQINFNEAVNPIRVSGTSAEVSNYIRVVDLATNAVVPGKFMISNQYKTVEFLSDNECGRNSCGERIFCLPENSNLKVEIVAANLAPCSSDTDCASKSPYSSCGSGICQEPSTLVNYPQAAGAMDGVIDMAFNSLDGNRNANAQGPISFYDENNPNPNTGDNFVWSFFISDIIDLNPPTINLTNAANNAGGASMFAPVTVNFSKLMMSSSLSTGQIIANNGQEDIAHKLVNILSFSSQPIGYWATNEGIDDSPVDGENDWTRMFIKHTDFADSTQYRAQVGSGVKDIYQNCFKACDGPACTGENATNPSCCSGVLSNVDGVINQCPL